MVSTLPPLLLLADKRPRVLDFILFVALFYFQCHFSLNLDELNYCRGLGTRALCRKKLIWKSADQLWWAISAAWRGAQEQVFIFRCQGYTHTCIQKLELLKNMQACVTHSLRSQRQRTGPLHLTVTSALSGFFFFWWSLHFALPFAFVNLWKHTQRS